LWIGSDPPPQPERAGAGRRLKNFDFAESPLAIPDQPLIPDQC
jgi:hypothetical protein